ncbi:unnamed protein product [Pedinophyceae sp. YPF-701]|nr:unnamed protein product [Pedinophyceae sp. YPF-701]
MDACVENTDAGGSTAVATNCVIAADTVARGVALVRLVRALCCTSPVQDRAVPSPARGTSGRAYVSHGIAQGTGYGGRAGDEASLANATAQASARQSAEAARLAEALVALNRQLSVEFETSVLQLDLPSFAALFGGPLPQRLAELTRGIDLANWDAGGAHETLVRAVLDLGGLLGSHESTVPLLWTPVDAGAMAARYGPLTAGDAAGARDGATITQHIADLAAQADTIVRHAEGDDLDQLLHIKDTAEQAGEAIRASAALGKAQWLDSVVAQLQQRVPAGAGAGAAGSGGADAALESTYKRLVSRWAFAEADLAAPASAHRFRQTVGAGAGYPAAWTKRVVKEYSAMRGHDALPVYFDSAVLVAWDENNMSLARACILPAPGSPYSHGAFVFDISVPADFPDRPPKVRPQLMC